MLSREGAKLRGRLVGAGKKRAREEEERNAAALPRAAAVDADDDEEDSRARAVTKKARYDPFEPKGKGKKKNKDRADAGAASAPPAAPPQRADERPAAASGAGGGGAGVKPDRPVPALNIVDVDVEMRDAPGDAAASRKKKKKKKKHGGDGGHSSAVGGPAPAIGPSAALSAPTQKTIIEIASSPEPQGSIQPSRATVLNNKMITSGTSCFIPTLSRLTCARAHAGTGRVGAKAQLPTNPPASPLRAPQVVPQSSPKRLDPQGRPLLNLDGPPPSSEDAQAESPKKKKRKRNKKKKAMTAASGPREIIDVDAYDDGDK